jgi:two-component system CheB/CheR fusion protein
MTEAYAHDVNGFKVGPESLACGLAMYTGEPVITPDVELEPLWAPYISMAHKHNYRGCWSFPVRTSDGPVLGTFALYFEKPRHPSPRELELASVLAHAAAIIISRHKASVERADAEEALRESEERIGKLFTLMPAAVYTCDAEGRITSFNRRAAATWGRK